MPHRMSTMRTRAKNTIHSSLRSRPARRYKEASSEDDFDDDAYDSNTDSELLDTANTETFKKIRNSRRLSTAPPVKADPTLKKRSTPSSEISSSPSAKKIKTGLHEVELPQQLAAQQTPKIEEKIPEWQTLPYHLLFQIFKYAAWPLFDDDLESNPSISWLLQTSRLCKSFAEPALSTLYFSPPLHPPTRGRSLIEQLRKQNATTTFNYRNKIRCLEIEVVKVLVRKSDGHDPIDLSQLIRLTPQLRSVRMHALSSRPLYPHAEARFKRHLRWVHKKEVFESMKENMISLASWKWDFSFSKPQSKNQENLFPWDALLEIHRSAPFQSLRHLELVSYHRTDQPQLSEISAAVEALPNLNSVIIENFSFGDEMFLLSLPQNLQTLEISSCAELTSGMLHSFLLTHGRALRDLTLNHDQSLNLRFLIDLRTSCPSLEVLKMDMTFFSSSRSFNDSEPKFDTLLLATDVPNWPSSLQTLELIHLRKWEMESAASFFRSLIDSAENLELLRSITIKTSIEIGWRDRASFRDRWITRLKKVFLRVSSPPNPYRRFLQLNGTENGKVRRYQSQAEVGVESDASSIDLFFERQSRTTQLNNDKETQVPEREQSSTKAGSTTKPVRRSRRIKSQEQNSPASSAHSPSDQAASPLSLRPKRVNQRYNDEDSEGSSQTQSTEDEGKDRDWHIQGLCNTVDVRIDNLRPAEMQFEEKDFLDEEMSGDEDWNGDVDDAGDGYAW